MYIFSWVTHVSFSYILDNPTRVVPTTDLAGSVRGSSIVVTPFIQTKEMAIAQKLRMVSKKSYWDSPLYFMVKNPNEQVYLDLDLFLPWIWPLNTLELKII